MGDDDPDAQAVFPEQGPNREKMASEYLPASDDWKAKTVLDLEDPAAVAALSQMGVMFPEVGDLQPLIDEFLDDFLKTQTSVGGASRDEYKSILVSMYGGNIDEDTARGAFVDALAAGDDD